MSTWLVKPLGEVCEINPRLPRNHDISDDREVSFVPMAAVDEAFGIIANGEVRPFAEVKKGYTYSKDDDVLFAKITPCMENGKAAIARELSGGVGFGSTEFLVLRSRGEVLPEWVFYFIWRQRFRDDAKRTHIDLSEVKQIRLTDAEYNRVRLARETCLLWKGTRSPTALEKRENYIRPEYY